MLIYRVIRNLKICVCAYAHKENGMNNYASTFKNLNQMHKIPENI